MELCVEAEDELLLCEESVTKAIVPIAMMIIIATTITVVPIAFLACLKSILLLMPQLLINSFVRTLSGVTSSFLTDNMET